MKCPVKQISEMFRIPKIPEFSIKKQCDRRENDVTAVCLCNDVLGRKSVIIISVRQHERMVNLHYFPFFIANCYRLRIRKYERNGFSNYRFRNRFKTRTMFGCLSSVKLVCPKYLSTVQI